MIFLCMCLSVFIFVKRTDLCILWVQFHKENRACFINQVSLTSANVPPSFPLTSLDKCNSNLHCICRHNLGLIICNKWKAETLEFRRLTTKICIPMCVTISLLHLFLYSILTATITETIYIFWDRPICLSIIISVTCISQQEIRIYSFCGWAALCNIHTAFSLSNLQMITYLVWFHILAIGNQATISIDTNLFFRCWFHFTPLNSLEWDEYVIWDI